MSCSAYVPWQYAPPIGHPHAVGLGPVFPPDKLPAPPGPGPASNPTTRTPPPRDPPEQGPPARGTDTARPDVGAIAMWLGAGLVLASVLMGYKGAGVGAGVGL